MFLLLRENSQNNRMVEMPVLNRCQFLRPSSQKSSGGDSPLGVITCSQVSLRIVLVGIHENARKFQMQAATVSDLMKTRLCVECPLINRLIDWFQIFEKGCPLALQIFKRPLV